MTMTPPTPLYLAARGYRAQLRAADGSPGPVVTVVQTLDGPVAVPDDWHAWHAAQTARRDYAPVPLEG